MSVRMLLWRFFLDLQSTLSLMRVYLNQVKASIQKDLLGPLSKRKFPPECLWTQAATSALPWVSGLQACPVDFGITKPQNHGSQLLKINLSPLSLNTHTHCFCFSGEPWLRHQLQNQALTALWNNKKKTTNYLWSWDTCEHKINTVNVKACALLSTTEHKKKIL